MRTEDDDADHSDPRAVRAALLVVTVFWCLVVLSAKWALS
jgi:hypothetical protein